MKKNNYPCWRNILEGKIVETENLEKIIVGYGLDQKEFLDIENTTETLFSSGWGYLFPLEIFKESLSLIEDIEYPRSKILSEEEDYEYEEDEDFDDEDFDEEDFEEEEFEEDDYENEEYFDDEEFEEDEPEEE